MIVDRKKAITNNSEYSPKISVIIPLYDGGKFIESTIMSVLTQTYDNYEILIVDDGSSDDGPVKVAKFIEQYPDKVHMLSHPDHLNHGIAPSRNLGIRNAKGDYIAFIDQDDIWFPHKLEKQITALRQFPDASLIYAKVVRIDESGETKYQGIHSTYGRGVIGQPQNMFMELIKENIIPNLTVLVKKSCLERVGLLDEGPRYEYEDWLLLSKLAFFYKFLFIPEVLAKWREHGNNYSSAVFLSGQFCDAEERGTIALFSFLMKESDEEFDEISKYFHRRVWRLFLRARSWGVHKTELEKHKNKLIDAFPTERNSIMYAFSISMLIRPEIASLLRRLRRIIIGT